MNIKGDYYYVLIAVAVIFIGFIYDSLYKRRLMKKLLSRAEKNWGENRERKPAKEYFYDLERSFIINENIDDKTWRDFNMELVAKATDHSESYLGSIMYRIMLRSGAGDAEQAMNRNDEVNSARCDKEKAIKIKAALSTLGSDLFNDVAGFVQNGIVFNSSQAIIYKFAAFMPIAVIGLFFVNKQLGLISLIVMMSVNIWLNERIKANSDFQLNTFRELSRIFTTAQIVEKESGELLKDRFDTLSRYMKNTSAVRRSVSGYRGEGSILVEFKLLFDFLSLIFLLEPLKFFRVAHRINEHREDVINIMKTLGEIDAVLAVASYLDTGVNIACADYNGEYGFEKLYHPLLADAVPYSLSLKIGRILLTGSNASGKSTFLKACAISQIFAQTFGFAFSKSYNTKYCRIISSMNSEDDISKGDSYFMAEAKGLLRIIKSVEDDGAPLFVVADELFRGTNTAERVGAATGFMNYMAGYDSIVLSATHDMELIDLLQDKYEMYHFGETIMDDDIIFDYKLKHGPTNSRNAFEILRIIGYPKNIYENAINISEKVGR